MRVVHLSIVAGLIILPALLQAGSRDAGSRGRATLSSTQTLSFDPAGVIQLDQSYGDIEIQGWDRPEVEITTIRSAPASSQDADALDDLDTVAVTAIKQGEDHLKITAEGQSRRLSKLALRDKPDADLKYVIKAPAKAKLVVHHDIGEVKVVNFKSDIEVINRIGEIGLSLPDLDAYRVDAQVRIGDVSSDVGCSEHRNLIGQQLRSSGHGARLAAAHRQLFLRVGVGDITIQRVKW